VYGQLGGTTASSPKSFEEASSRAESEDCLICDCLICDCLIYVTVLYVTVLHVTVLSGQLGGTTASSPKSFEEASSRAESEDYDTGHSNA